MMSESWTYHAADLAGTERLGQALAAALPIRALVTLSGPLGAGKTRLVQALATALGVDRRDVVSPTFVLVHEYIGPRPIIHLDAYRIRDDDEFLQLGIDEYLAGPNLVLIEWAERVDRCLPEERLQITIEPGEGEERRFVLEPRGAEYAAAVEKMREGLGTRD
jgi:tRNA threonylcarbamoyladenosine biosynthesis protein TsaE